MYPGERLFVSMSDFWRFVFSARAFLAPVTRVLGDNTRDNDRSRRPIPAAPSGGGRPARALRVAKEGRVLTPDLIPEVRPTSLMATNDHLTSYERRDERSRECWSLYIRLTMPWPWHPCGRLKIWYVSTFISHVIYVYGISCYMIIIL